MSISDDDEVAPPRERPQKIKGRGHLFCTRAKARIAFELIRRFGEKIPAIARRKQHDHQNKQR